MTRHTDYTDEQIINIIKKSPTKRIKDIAKMLGLNPTSAPVSKRIKSLRETAAQSTINNIPAPTPIQKHVLDEATKILAGDCVITRTLKTSTIVSHLKKNPDVRELCYYQTTRRIKGEAASVVRRHAYAWALKHPDFKLSYRSKNGDGDRDRHWAEFYDAIEVSHGNLEGVAHLIANVDNMIPKVRASYYIENTPMYEQYKSDETAALAPMYKGHWDDHDRLIK